MDTNRFDAATRSLASRLTRRTALKAAGAGAGVAALTVGLRHDRPGRDRHAHDRRRPDQ